MSSLGTRLGQSPAHNLNGCTACRVENRRTATILQATNLHVAVRRAHKVSITIRLKRNGPYLIALDDAAQVTVVDAEGKPLVPEPGRSIALCRCGGSSTKPFCDGTHRGNGFVGTSEPAASRPRPEATDPGITPQ